MKAILHYSSEPNGSDPFINLYSETDNEKSFVNRTNFDDKLTLIVDGKLLTFKRSL